MLRLQLFSQDLQCILGTNQWFHLYREVVVFDNLLLWSQEDVQNKEEMAQRKALLLEKQQRRSEELKKRKQWHEQERENR